MIWLWLFALSLPSLPWTSRYDLDGDQRVDPIEVDFSGGAHCCYTLAVELSASGRRVTIPFQLDGGYVGGLDLGDPDNFAIEVDASGVAALRLHPLDEAGHRRVSLRGGRLRVTRTR